jgi:prepilin-type N-terminal cleavage/methylation domain-containing protein
MQIKIKGFTLIELLIGITILVMVLSTVYASYNIGIKTFRKIEAQSYLNQNSRQCWRMLSRDLRCAFLSKSNNATNFIGQKDRVSFSTYSPDYSRSKGNVTQVTYLTGKDGLIRQEPDIKQVVAPLARSLELRYFDGKMWKETWDSAVLPESVEIKVSLLAEDKKTTKTITTKAPVMSDYMY